MDLPSNVRYGTSADNILLAELGRETFYDTFAEQNTAEDMSAYLSATFSPEKQAGELSDPNSRFLILEEEGRIAGFAQIYFGSTSEGVKAQNPMEIVRIYARKVWIGKGIGAQLMQTCLKEAERAGCDVVWLGVWEKNPRAIAFYQKWGFEKVGTHVFQVGSDPQRDFVMVRPVMNRNQ